MLSHRLFLALLGTLLLGPLVSAHEPPHADHTHADDAADTDGSHTLIRFARQQLCDEYYSEGAAAGDLNGDGHTDVVYGPLWYAGPDFETARPLAPASPQDRNGYADRFFHWVYDFDQDGHADVLTVGFPGTAAVVYQNPGPDGLDAPWPRHEVFDWVSNESPQFVDLVGDSQPELVCTRDGFYGYATFDSQRPWTSWDFHRISPQVAARRFGHGLGVGDVDGDGRQDVIVHNGWYQQPEQPSDAAAWTFHPYTFSAPGGADMYAYDVDGDGDNDVITSINAHAYGLAWFEQIQTDGKIDFRRHTIMGETAADNPYGVVFTEPHGVQLVDIDGDGLKDICTGKTYWSHHRKSPLWDAGAVVYWFELQRGPQGVDWVPHKIDDQAGIGRGLCIADVNGDDRPDFVCGGMKGCHVLVQQRESVDQATWAAAQPKRKVAMAAGLEPEEAAQRMTVPEGFHVQLAAGEPQVHQPVALAMDPRGRIWVAEAYTYPQRAPEGEGRDKIIILEDADRDGRFETRKEFATGLNLVSGLEVGFGGVWVGAAPYLMFIPDADGDDTPDGPPQILLDGFGYQDTHETLNAFNWGPDGWLYGCHGVFTHSAVGPPGTPDEDRVRINAGVWRYHPTEHRFERFAEGTSNPWGVDFDDHGHAFITACVIPHLFHVIPGGRYHRQAGRHFNPHTYDDLKTIADHAHFSGNIRDHAWWGHEPADIPDATSDAGGGHAHCGAMIYLGDNWPAEYRNSIYFNNIHGNRVNNDVLEREGSGFVGRHGKDFLFANDHWFRGINLRYGPDGSVYLIDWYDKNACHRATPEIWDRSNGRLYRVRYGDRRPVKVDLAALPDDELVALQLHENDWYVRTARRLLQQRAAAGDISAAREALRQMMREQSEATRRLRALWCLHVTGGVPAADLLRLLQDPDEHVRCWAVRLSAESDTAPPLERWTELARNDSSALVRLSVASALQRLPAEQRWAVVEVLLSHGEDADDHNLPLLVWYAAEPLVTLDAQRAMRLARASHIPRVTRFLIRRAASEERTRGAAVQQLTDASAEMQTLILDEILRSLEGQVKVAMPESWQAAYEALLDSGDADTVAKADQLALVLGDRRILPRMRAQLADAEADLPQRRQALEALLRVQDPDAAEALLTALDAPPLRAAAIRALAAYDHPQIAPRLIGLYPSLSVDMRQDVINTLASRPASALRLLAAVEQDKIAAGDLHAYTIRQLRSFGNEELNRRIASSWGTVRQSSEDKRKRIEALKAELTAARLAAADLSNGRRLFEKSCASCHVLFGNGGNIGPDITGSNRANLDYLLDTIVDPNALVGKDYQMSVLLTVDGRVINGLVQKETDTALTVRTVNDTVVIPKDDIESRELSASSLMPEQLLEALSTEQRRDLVAYLRSPTQVALKGPPAPIDETTGRVEGAIEGETLEPAKDAPGQTRAQPMGGFRKDRWSGNAQRWWTGAKPGDQLELPLEVAAEGAYQLQIVMTKARDYAVVQLRLDGQPLGEPIDLFNSPDVITTGVLSFETQRLEAGSHTLSIEIVGANPAAQKAYMVGIDYVRLEPAQ
ncbi:PVC-type heme-binding CxxCH protein [Roseimaritima sediminicola]|uniref:PVC-type heme-binding CxxCH protein n=1 Tax=Roseimaritima sediminicola TaxID=2662066 RepID=UPI0012984749|nr:PVC-type heme-binding CxxCH protein [Roseimaritima sediminicola]